VAKVKHSPSQPLGKGMFRFPYRKDHFSYCRSALANGKGAGLMFCLALAKIEARDFWAKA